MRLCVHSSKPYVFLSLSSQSGLEAVDQCVVMNEYTMIMLITKKLMEIQVD